MSWPAAPGSIATGAMTASSIWTARAENGFIPDLPAEPVDLIYLCFPNNPTGATITADQLKTWVDYAAANQAIILYDAAYEAFIRDDALPHSIYEIEGAREVAIEFRSFSKTAGFTGTRCAYTVVPTALMAFTAAGDAHSVHSLWNRRHSTKFNGVSYPVQRAAEAVYSDAGKRQVAELIDYYMANAGLIRQEMQALGYACIGGENSPYIWVSTGKDSWAFFDMLLEKAGVVCTPGAGFGTCGEGYIRISAFNSHENVNLAMTRIRQALAVLRNCPMPMSAAFENRLYPLLKEIVAHFGTPFHIYDEAGIRETGHRLKRCFCRHSRLQGVLCGQGPAQPRHTGHHGRHGLRLRLQFDRRTGIEPPGRRPRRRPDVHLQQHDPPGVCRRHGRRGQHRQSG